ncbi:Membrane protein involved in the export of O-antigen and teichoic acid [Actinopolymorpha cephalotaxi]|uniref:Membrane protein involved in the export of O-antigen and teichoic acid n=1 Tax=Actinopolymorpha cephalotaxi TaxID=504797 RepID=A0A1I2U755_9ACTN|nr:lipopolysaccharide biosynthesis protein [Actinopolymorpha cephalotaxi]NYH86471.1 O-antigen/teichoic acid export membrane protein [Actinopolymorpha cephalotaxi]SFG72995.1 Membrane protein involved in the export of O-antigen and teichoic acid [Actinopolymorpha cephalotaxi]
MPNDTLPNPDADPTAGSPVDDGSGAGPEREDEQQAAARDRLTGRLVRGTLWSMLGIAALGVTRLVYTALIGRTGDPARLAAVNSQVSLAFLATFATAAATGAGAAKFLPLTAARSGPAAAAAVHRRLTRWTVAATVAVVMALAAFGRVFLPDADWTDVVWVCALVTAYGAYSYTKSVLYGHHLPHRYAVLEVAADVVILVLTVVVVWWVPTRLAGDAPGLLLAPLVAGYAAFAVAATRSAPRVRPGELPALRGELGGFVAYTALGIAAGQGFFQVSMIVARHATGGSEAGAYAAAMSLVGPAFFLPRAMGMAFFPAAAEAVGRGDQAALARHTDLVTRLLVLTTVPLFGLTAMLGGPVLGLVFGPAYADGGPAFAVLVLAVFWYVVAVPSVNVLSAQNLTLARIPPLASAAGVVVGVATWLAVGTRWGAVGVAAGYLAGMLVQAGVPLVVAFSRLRLRWGSRLPRYAAGLAAGIAAATVAVLTPRPGVIAVCATGFLLAFGLLNASELAGTVRRVRELRAATTRR